MDADAVNCLALDEFGDLKPLKLHAPILTPHPKEMSRISGLSVQEIQANRIESASRFAKANRLTLILKGARTLIAFPDGSVSVNPTGNPGMATAGSGDVLTGVIAGLIAQGLKPRQRPSPEFICTDWRGTFTPMKKAPKSAWSPETF